jgi:hypothetical protein
MLAATPATFLGVIALIVLALGLTAYVFRRRLTERGPKKGVAANPAQVRRQNPPDPARR